MKLQNVIVSANLVVAASLVCEPAHAHLVTTGLGPLFDGISHFSLSPSEIFPVAGLGLFAGMRGPEHSRYALFVTSAAWFLGSCVAWVGLNVAFGWDQDLTAGIFLLIGCLLAADLRVSPLIVGAVGALLGLLRGNLDLGTAPASGSALLALVGIVATVFTLLALSASFSLPLKEMWMRVTVRVMGSWIAALGLLLVGWSIHNGKHVLS